MITIIWIWFFAPFLGDNKEIGPMAQTFVRRAMQIRNKKRHLQKRGSSKAIPNYDGEVCYHMPEPTADFFIMIQMEKVSLRRGSPTSNLIHQQKHMHPIGMKIFKLWGQ